MKKRKIYIFIIAFIILSIIITIFINSILKDPSILTNGDSNLAHILSYACLSFIQILFPIVPGEPIELLAGYLFGKIDGTLICFICEALGSIIVILLVKRFKKKITSVYYEDNIFNKLNKFKQKKYFPIFALIFIMPGTPKDLLCYFAGIADYDLFSALLIVTVGRIPSIITSTLAAGFLKEKRVLISIIIYAITVLICTIDLLIYKKITQNKEKN